MTLVTLQVSDPYSRTDLTLDKNILSLVFCDKEEVLDTGLNTANTCLAFPMRALTSLSVSPVLFMILPRY